MAISVADNFSYQGTKPLDARVKYASVSEMKNVSAATLYDGILAYVTGTKKYYTYDSTNETDPDTGKWREFESGGGSGGEGGHTIEDYEGTALTQRDTLKFDDSFDISDDSTNEKTVVSLNKLAAGEMDDIVNPLPSVKSPYAKYSTSEQIVGEWIDGKPIYQKTISNTISCDTNLVVTEKSIDISSLNIDKMIDIKATNSVASMPLVMWNGASNMTYVIRVYYNISTGDLVISANRKANDGQDIYITIQYTKTTD